MKRNIILLLIAMIVAAGCQTDFETKDVVYRVKGLEQDYTVTYMNEDGESITEQVSPGSTDYTWTYSWSGEQGSIVYLYLKYYDVNPPDDKFRMAIMVDGKMLRYADEYDKDDLIMKIDTSAVPPDTTYVPVFYAKRAGIIPY